MFESTVIHHIGLRYFVALYKATIPIYFFLFREESLQIFNRIQYVASYSLS